MLVSIGLGLYNSMKFLKETLESLLSQSFTDFEIVIVDDASTDGSFDFCRQYDDKRIKLYQNKIRTGSRLGGYDTHEKTYQLSQGKYYCLFGHDDIVPHTFLEDMVNVIESDDNLVLAFPKFYWIHYYDNWIDRKLVDLSELISEINDRLITAKNYMLMSESSGKANLIHSLIRKSHLEKFGSISQVYNSGTWGNDYLRVFNLLLHGNISYVDSTYYLKRIVKFDRWGSKSSLNKLQAQYIDEYKNIIKDSSLRDNEKSFMLEMFKRKKNIGVK